MPLRTLYSVVAAILWAPFAELRKTALSAEVLVLSSKRGHQQW